MLIGRIFERYCVSVSVILRFAKKASHLCRIGLRYATQNRNDFKEEYP